MESNPWPLQYVPREQYQIQTAKTNCEFFHTFLPLEVYDWKIV